MEVEVESNFFDERHGFVGENYRLKFKKFNLLFFNPYHQEVMVKKKSKKNKPDKLEKPDKLKAGKKKNGKKKKGKKKKDLASAKKKKPAKLKKSLRDRVEVPVKKTSSAQGPKDQVPLSVEKAQKSD